MEESDIINSNQSYTNWIWNYGKQALKGLGVMSLGVLGYMGLRSYWQTDNTITQTNSESTDLVAATDESTSVIKKDLTNTPLSTLQNIWNSAERSLQYRHKRGVVPVTGEFQVNINTFNNSMYPAIASLPNGEFVITWQGYNASAGNYSIYAQRFDVNGTRLGNEFQVNTNTINNRSPSIMSLPNGDFVITWQSSNSSLNYFYSIYAQRFDVNGIRLGNEFQVNTNTIKDVYPAIASLPNGEFVITWQGLAQDGRSVNEIYAQRFDVNGAPIGNGFQVNNDTTIDQSPPAIASLPNGKFVIAWSSTFTRVNWNVYAQRFGVNSVRLGNEFQVYANTTNTYYPAVASLSNGDFVITWQGLTQQEGRSDVGIYAQRFDVNGTRLGNEFQVNTNTTNNRSPAIMSLPNDDFVITWQSPNSNLNNYSIYAQRFDVNGAPIGSEFQVNTNTTGNQFPATASLPNGEFVITWQSESYNVYARLFTILYTPSELNRNSLTIDQGQTLVLTPSQLLALSESVPANNLTLLATNVTAGWFANINNFTVPIFNFTQVDVNNGQIQFTQDDSYNAPGYQIAVFDGTNMLAPQSAVVDFDQKPMWKNYNKILIANHRQVQLSFTKLLATDDKTNSQVFFDLRNVSHGAFALSSVADPFTNPISNFTQLQVNASQINFAHDGSNSAPSCEIRACDGRLYTAFQPCQFAFTPNQSPQLSRNELTLVKGEVKVVDGKSLAATKPDATAEEFNQLMFNFTVVQHGQFVLTTNSSQAVTWAQQSYITAGHLLFKHDGSDQAPSYNVTVSDAFNVTASQKANITFSLTAPARDNTNVITGAVVGATGGALLLAGIGIFGAYRYRRSKQLEAQRANYPLANALYHELKIPDTEDFQSEKGIAFTNAVDSLNNELIRADIDIKQMVPEEITELAAKLATATKAQLGKKINPLDIQDYVAGIVATAMTLSGKNITASANMELSAVADSDNKDAILFAAVKKRIKEKNIDLDTLSASEIDELVKPLLDPSEGAKLTV